MPLYKYESFNHSGKIISGTIDVSSLDMAKKTLQGQGLMPFKVEELGADKIESFAYSFFEPKIDIKTKIIFTKQLAVLLKAGVPLLQALELLIEQFEKKFKRILINIKDGVKSGQSFAGELGKYPKVFSNIYVQLVRAGEASGKLHLVLENLIDYMAREEIILNGESYKKSNQLSYVYTWFFVFSCYYFIDIFSSKDNRYIYKNE